MTLSEFTAEIETRLSSFAQSGDIDRTSVKNHVLNCLKIFGNNICDLSEKIVDVSNSRAILPEEFKSLRLALYLEPIGCDTYGDRDILQTDNYIYKEYIENPAYFDEVNQEYVRGCDSKIITEKITVSNKNVDRYYNYKWLSLVKGINKKVLSSNCYNIHPAIRNSYPNEINITSTTLNANFRNGKVYLQYYGLPVDETGEIIIPELTTGDILIYIENYVKIQLAEDIIANNRNPQGLTQLYPVWKGQDREFKAAAIKEAKFWGLQKDWHVKYKKLNQRDFQIYNLPSLKF